MPEAERVYQKAMQRKNMRSFGKQEFGKTFTPSLYRDSPHMNQVARNPPQQIDTDSPDPKRFGDYSPAKNMLTASKSKQSRNNAFNIHRFITDNPHPLKTKILENYQRNLDVVLSQPVKGPAIWSTQANTAFEPKRLSVFNSTQSLKNVYHSA